MNRDQRPTSSIFLLYRSLAAATAARLLASAVAWWAADGGGVSGQWEELVRRTQHYNQC